MITQLSVTKLLLMLLVSFGGLHMAKAYYDPGTQRWLNRDPLGEEGGMNLYAFVDSNPISAFDAFGLHRGGAGASAPAPDTCDPERRKQINDAMEKACNRLSSPCPTDDLDCQALMDAAKKICDSKKKPKVRCARTGDKKCSSKGLNGETPCGYESGSGGGITLCERSWPADGSNCQGNGGPMSLDCVLVHELGHMGAGRKSDPDDTNKLQKCVGCAYGAPHVK